MHGIQVYRVRRQFRLPVCLSHSRCAETLQSNVSSDPAYSLQQLSFEQLLQINYS